MTTTVDRPFEPFRIRCAARAVRGLLLIALLAPLGRPIAVASEDRVELLRDPWGVPHIFAETDEGAMFGLGYVMAHDRAFQMHLTRRIMQGRLAETIGDMPLDGRRESTLDLDRKNRTFGWSRVADQVASALDEDVIALLEAYCAGVNQAWSERGADLDPLFARFETTPEPWTPADCLLSWWHLSQFFATDGTRDLIAWRNRGREEVGGRPGSDAIPPDDEVAVIQREDIEDSWLDRVREYFREQGYEVSHEETDANAPFEPGPKFSHAWVVGGERLTTGSTALVGMPQTVVANPPLFHEFHIVGETFNARGIGVSGSPALLIGFTDRVAWSLTALGADQADLFRLRTDPEHHPDAYEFDGDWRGMTIREESIAVKGGDPVSIRIRETHLGPVVSEFAFASPEDDEVALRRVPLCDSDRETISGALAMIRAADASEFDDALDGWRFPSANIVFGDRSGTIGYRTIGAFPLRSPEAEGNGSLAMDGSEARYEWRGFVPHDLAPHLLEPASGVLFSANHRPIGGFYPIPLGNATGSMGDTVRSWRLRELLAIEGPMTPDQVFAIAEDSVNPSRREVVRLGLHLRDRQGEELEPDALRALEILEPWLARGARSDRDDPATPLAMELSMFFRVVATPLADEYGGGESGLARWLRDARHRIEADPSTRLSEPERDFVEHLLETAWEAASAKYGDDPETWLEEMLRELASRRIPSHRGLDPMPSIAPDRELTMPPLPSPDGGTIRSDGQRAYVQFVRLDDPDASRSLLPQGNIEGGDLTTRDLWQDGTLHPAPLSRGAVEQVAEPWVTLDWPPKEAGR